MGRMLICNLPIQCFQSCPQKRSLGSVPVDDCEESMGIISIGCMGGISTQLVKSVSAGMPGLALMNTLLSAKSAPVKPRLQDVFQYDGARLLHYAADTSSVMPFRLDNLMINLIISDLGGFAFTRK